jgi:hypothetical protein
LKIVWLNQSEIRSRDAGIAINAHPNGRMSFGLHGVQLGGKRGLHIRRRRGNTISNRLSNGLRSENCVVGFRRGARLI